jgi:hypothetical protein
MILLLTDHALLEKMRRAGQNFVHVTVAGATPDALTLLYMAILLVGGILVATVVGLALGALGGVIGKAIGQSHVPAPQVYRESMYPGIPPAPPAGTPGASSPPSSGEEKQ